MSDFTEGQKLVIREIVDKAISELEERQRQPWYKSPKIVGSLGASVVVVLLFLINHFALPQKFFTQFLHDIIGTEAAIASRMNTLSDSPMRENIDTLVNESIDTRLKEETADLGDKPFLPRFVSRMVRAKPTLSFHGRHVFGLDRVVRVATEQCGEASARNASSEAPVAERTLAAEDCFLEGVLASDDLFQIPFYGYPKDGHEIHLILQVLRTDKSGRQVPDETSMEGIEVYLNERTEPLSSFRELREKGLYYSDITKLVSEDIPEFVQSDARFFHVLSVQSDQNKLNEMGEIVDVSALILVNRGPRG